VMAGITDEHLQALASIGLIILGYAWLENRLKKIVTEAFMAHNKTDELRRQILEDKIQAVQNEVRAIHRMMPKRSTDPKGDTISDSEE
jgi:hypothetical protein